MRSRVGVRELRQNLSVYLRRVLEGDTFEVTERGHPVAVLGPVRTDETPLMRLRREGRVRPAKVDVLALGPPPGPRSRKLSEALEAEREERL